MTTKKKMKKITILLIILCTSLACASTEVNPIKVLMITGGGWHDYEEQAPVLKEAIESQINAEVTIKWTSTKEHPVAPTEGKLPEVFKGDFCKGVVKGGALPPPAKVRSACPAEVTCGFFWLFRAMSPVAKLSLMREGLGHYLLFMEASRGLGDASETPPGSQTLYDRIQFSASENISTSRNPSSHV